MSTSHSGRVVLPALAALTAVLALASCGGGDNEDDPTASPPPRWRNPDDRHIVRLKRVSRRPARTPWCIARPTGQTRRAPDCEDEHER